LSYRKENMRNRWVWTLILSLSALPAVWAQSDTQGQDQQPATGAEQNQTANPPASGQESAIPSASENPPISGLDQPSLEPGAVTRSFLAPGAMISESADSNLTGNLGSGATSPDVGGTTRAMGSLTLQRIWTRYETDLQYIGGGVFYEGVNRSANQIQEVELAQRIKWRTGQLALRDSLTYLPEGAFGEGSYGGSGALQSGLAGLGQGMGGLSSGTGSGIGGTLSASQFGSLGEEPRLTNSAVADLVEAVNPRSSLTFAGSYGFVHFTDNNLGLIDSDQVAAQAGYDHQINRTDQIALTYGFQDFHFPQIGGSSASTNTVHFVYGHRLNGRMDFIAGAGPQFTRIESSQFPSSTRISASGNLKLRYRFSHASMQLEYRHYNTNGSGYFLGAASDVASLSALRSLGRVWELNSDAGFASNKRLEPVGVVVPATSDQYLFAGGAVHRHIGRHYRMFMSYQFNRFSFNSTVCDGTGDCGRISNRHVGTLGFEWYPRPVRLD